MNGTMLRISSRSLLCFSRYPNPRRFDSLTSFVRPHFMSRHPMETSVCMVSMYMRTQPPRCPLATVRIPVPALHTHIVNVSPGCILTRPDLHCFYYQWSLQSGMEGVGGDDKVTVHPKGLVHYLPNTLVTRPFYVS